MRGIVCVLVVAAAVPAHAEPTWMGPTLISTQGPITVLARWGQPDIEGLLDEPPFLEGGGERVRLDVAEVHRNSGPLRLVLAPRRALRPLTTYRLVSQDPPSGGIVSWDRTFVTTAGAESPGPEWAAEPQLHPSIPPKSTAMSGPLLTVQVPARGPAVVQVRVTPLCEEGGRTPGTYSAPVSEDRVEVFASCECCCEGNVKATEWILVLEDAAGRLSAPRRLSATPKPPEPWQLRPLRELPDRTLPWPLGVLLFGLAPFGLGYAAVRWRRGRRA